MTTDFKASQVQTNRVIAKDSAIHPGSNQILIYSIDADDPGAPNQGSIDGTKFDTSLGIGTDILLFVSGGIGQKDQADAYSVTVIGGDLHVSGNLSVAGTGNTGIKYWLESTDNITVPSRYQYLIQGPLILDAGAIFTTEPDGILVTI